MKTITVASNNNINGSSLFLTSDWSFVFVHVPPASVRVILTHLISLLRAKEVFGHVLRQHVGDQRLVPPPHLKNLLLVVVHADLPQEQLPGLKLELKKKEERKITLRSKHRLVRSVQMCLGKKVTHMT